MFELVRCRMPHNARCRCGGPSSSTRLVQLLSGCHLQLVQHVQRVCLLGAAVQLVDDGPGQLAIAFEAAAFHVGLQSKGKGRELMGALARSTLVNQMWPDGLKAGRGRASTK